MYYKTCPYCGAHLDPGERCDCQNERNEKEDTADAPAMPSKQSGISTDPILSDPRPNVNDCLRLRQIRQQAGAMGKDMALVVRDVFPKFNRQLLAQCEAYDKYGVIIHPEGLRTICAAYGVQLERDSNTPVITAPESRRKPNRRLARKLTFRMKDEDYALLERRVQEGGYLSSQAWLYDVVMKALRGEAAK